MVTCIMGGFIANKRFLPHNLCCRELRQLNISTESNFVISLTVAISISRCFIWLSYHQNNFISDITISIYSFSEGISLRPAYATMALLSIYIFLPMRNNFLAMLIGVIVSSVYVLIFALFTYDNSPELGIVVRVCD